MKASLTQEILDRIVEETAGKKNVHGFVMHVGRGDSALTSSAGNIDVSSRFFAASVTKLFVTAAILKLEAAGRLALHDRISAHLPGDMIRGLHVKDGVDRSETIGVAHLLSNTSGIPDYFDKETMNSLLANNDRTWGLWPTLESAKKKQAGFLPGRKAQYCDTNFQLLGAIIEARTGRSIDEAFDEMIIGPLGLSDTYMYRGGPDERLVPMYYKDRRLELPRYIASVGAEGGIVSTAGDLGLFLRGFFGGAMFDPARLEELYVWRLVFAPGLFFYGIGISNQPISLLNLKNGLRGHWGHSGAFAFQHSKSGTLLSGTVNQFTGHNHAVGAMIKALRHPI